MARVPSFFPRATLRAWREPSIKSCAMPSSMNCYRRVPKLYGNDIQLPVSMGALLEAWISDDPAQTKWLRDHSLRSERYRERISKTQQTK